MQEWLFNPPWWIHALTGVVGVAVWWQGNSRQLKGPKLVGLALLALTALHIAASVARDTPQEQAIARTRDIVLAVEARDWPTFENLLDPETSLLIYPDRDALVRGAPPSVEGIGLKDVRITSIKADDLGGAINVDISLTAETEYYPVPTRWRFVYTEFADGWILERIEFVESTVGNLTAEGVQRSLR